MIWLYLILIVVLSPIFVGLCIFAIRLLEWVFDLVMHILFGWDRQTFRQFINEIILELKEQDGES